MAGSVNLYQIYWKEEQLSNLFDFSIPYKNEKLTYFFENSVIVDIVPRETSDKVGIASHALRQKVGHGIPMRQEFTKEVIEWDYDVLYLGRKQVEHRMLYLLDQWHPGAREILELIFVKLGLDKPKDPKDPIYQNHFIAKTEIYKEYVGQFLKPAIELMSYDEEISKMCMEDSQYFKLKPPYSEFATRCREAFGIDYVPLHTFICERFFSCWIHGKPIKVRYL